LPIGRSVLGTFIHNRRAHPAHTVAEAYLLSDWSNGVVNTNDLIAGIRGGVLRDVSIGFHGGRIVCSICNQDMFGFRTVCEHFPGVTYDVNGEDEPVQAIGLVEDARLSEFSIVYKGACPGAMIDKAYRLLESGALTKKDAKALDSRFRMRLALSDVHPVAITTSGAVTIEGVMVDDEPLANEQPADPPPATLDAGEEAPVLPAPRAVERDKIALGEEMDEVAIRELLTRAGAPEGVDLEWVVTELQRLRPLADVGAAYRVDLIEDALAEGVRAKGAKFPTEQWRGMLQKLDLAEIKLHRAGWQSDADDLFTKGRQTTEEAAAPLAPNEKASIAVLPDLAYRA
jgi:hypothetical protein